MNNDYKDGSNVEPVHFTEEVDLQQETANLETQTEQIALQDEIKPCRGWNFGAFTFPLIWALCNGCMWQCVFLI